MQAIRHQQREVDDEPVEVIAGERAIEQHHAERRHREHGEREDRRE
jgi:hypothetical protein